jgi:hypothetical protein
LAAMVIFPNLQKFINIIEDWIPYIIGGKIADDIGIIESHYHSADADHHFCVLLP